MACDKDLTTATFLKALAGFLQRLFGRVSDGVLIETKVHRFKLAAQIGSASSALSLASAFKSVFVGFAVFVDLAAAAL